MIFESLQKRIQKIKEIKSTSSWGTYYIGQYYFTIQTNKKQKQLGVDIKSKKGLTREVQIQLQKENLPALFHEYIHYLHEVSTVIGNIGLGLDLVLKSDFSKLLSPDLDKIDFKGYENASNNLKERLDKVLITQEFIFGTHCVEVNEIISINTIQDFIYLPFGDDFQEAEVTIPEVSFKDSSGKTEKLRLGKFYLYEGLAYELDRLVDQQFKGIENIHDYSIGTEYTVIRQIANFLLPNISKKYFLSIASLSLSHLDSGSAYIGYLYRYLDYLKMGFKEDDIIDLFKSEVKTMLNLKRLDFNAAQDEFLKIFEKRQQLHKAFSLITNLNKISYNHRINNPTFEVDLVFQGKYTSILELIPMCDYMYLFKDKIDFMRDFLGTTTDEENSQALKALLSYAHYYDVHFTESTDQVVKNPDKKGNLKCPFYYCCDLQIRINKEATCRNEPWKIFEISVQTDKKYCWYGQGILEFKGPNLKS